MSERVSERERNMKGQHGGVNMLYVLVALQVGSSTEVKSVIGLQGAHKSVQSERERVCV